MALLGLAPDVIDAMPLGMINTAVDIRLRMLGAKKPGR